MYRIYDSDGSMILGPVCGDQVPDQITSVGSKLTILFSSDADIEAPGFAARWRRVRSERKVQGVSTISRL